MLTLRHQLQTAVISAWNSPTHEPFYFCSGFQTVSEPQVSPGTPWGREHPGESGAGQQDA